jgi:hypothetical protein
MNLEVETSLAAWLRSQPAFDGIPVHTGQSSDPIPNDQPVLIVGVESTEAIVRGLYKVSASIVLATPSVVDSALDTHAALASSLKTSLLAADQLAASFAAPLTLAGADLSSWSESQQDSRWLSTAALSLGLIEPAI